MTRPPLPPINFRALGEALLPMADTLVPAWMPGGHRRGAEYFCGSLAGGEGSSCAVNLVTGKWAEFNGDVKGADLVSLYAAIHGVTPAKAAMELADQHGLHDVAGIVNRGAEAAPPRPPPPAPPPSAKAQREPEGWKTQLPVPDYAPEPTFWHPYRPQTDIIHTAAYRLDGQLLGFAVRFRTSDGGKETLPLTWCQSVRDGSAKWHWRQWDEPRPLYIPCGKLPAGRTVVLVEGEIKAEVLQALLDAGALGVYCVVSWPGGSKAWAKALWSWLAGCAVLIWPDCDSKREQLTKKERDACPDEAALQAAKDAKPYLPAEKQPGLKAALGIGAHLRDEHGCDVSMLPCDPPGVKPDGWDARDAIETDGWGFAEVLAFFAQATRLLAPAPPDEATKPEATAKKIDLPAEADPGGDGDGDGDGDGEAGSIPWWLKPYWDADKGRWLVSRKLVIAALSHDEKLTGVLGVNQLSNNIEARRAWPWPYGKPGPITGAVDLMLGRYLSKTYGLPSINRAALMEAIETVAHESPFHPVVDYLQGLEHDNRQRIDKWLIIALGERPDTLPKPVFDYLSMVGRFWLLGMVRRVMEPGCKFDYCPVLEGPGGLGKSTLVETLATSAWFSDTHFDVGRGKEGQEQVQGLWVYEIAELANFGKSEINIIKAFISAKVDRYRPSYGRVVESYARQCVMVGTTNERTYLRDRTGNRRFWPVPVRNRVDIAWVTRNRDQLFAEAMALYAQDVPYTPSPQDEARLFVPMQESRLVETAVLSELQFVLTRPPTQTGIAAEVNELTSFVTLGQLTRALGVDAAKSNPGLESQIRGWMDHEGWQRVKRQINGVRAHGYERPRDWPRRDVGDEPPTAAKPAPPAPDAPPDASPPPSPAAVHFDGDADERPF